MNFPWHLPWPSSCIRNIAAASAACSSCSSSLASWASAAAGSTDLEDSFAQDPQGLGVVVAAWSSSHCCALGATHDSASSGRASTARTMTAAWSTNSWPAASAARTGSCRSVSSALASFRSRWAAARVGLGGWAHQFAVTWRRTRRRSGSSRRGLRRGASARPLVLRRGRVAQRLAGFLVGHRPGRLVGQLIERSSISAAATVIGCPRCLVDAVLVMDQSKHSPPTVMDRVSPYSTGVSRLGRGRPRTSTTVSSGGSRYAVARSSLPLLDQRTPARPSDAT